MLILTRKPGQCITIEPNAGLDPETPVRELFANGPIEVIVGRVDGMHVKLAIQAHPDLQILREELRTAPKSTSRLTGSRSRL